MTGTAATPAPGVRSALLDKLARLALESPNAPAFLVATGDRYISITRGQAMRDVDAVARSMRDVYGEGATVALLGENSYEWITCHLACLFAGTVIVPLDTSLSPAEIASRICFTGAKLVVYTAQNAAKIREAAKLTAGLKVDYVGFGSAAAEKFVVEGRKALSAGAPSLLLEKRDESRTASIVFTSGTTSTPRGAELSLASFSAFPEFASSVLPAEQGMHSLMALPLHHIFGIASTYFLLSSGVSLGICPDFRRLFDYVWRFRADCLFLVPALAEILAQKAIAKRATGSGSRYDEDDGPFPVKWLLTGGAPLMRRTYENLQSLGVCVLEGYGLTETCSLYSLSPYADPRPGTAGLAAANCETALSPDGELLIRGPCVMKGYYREPEATARVLSPDGWLRTGDSGAISDDGYVTVSGRRNRSIVLSSGKKVAPEELEREISALPGVLEVLVSGEEGSRAIVAEIYATVPKEIVARGITMLNARLPIYKRVRKAVFRDTPFERTASGKIRVDRRNGAK